MTQIKRTPEFFPKMKVRGARRKQLAPLQRAKGSFKRVGETARGVSAAFTELFDKLKVDAVEKENN